jgi:hypothetical protein
MVGVFYLKYFLYLCGMKIKLPTILDFGLRMISLILLFFITVKIDVFSFGMMNPTQSIKFGLGVSLFLGNNILAMYLVTKIVSPITNKIKL